MRASSTVMLIASAFLLVGCNQTTSPASPTSVPAIGASPTSSPLAASAAAQHQVPFKGTFQGSDTGRYSFTHVITFPPPLTGSAHWIAANGDSIDTTSVIVSSVLGPVVRTNTENHTITGGTGRFSGAQGSFTVVRTHVLAPSDDGTHVTSGSFDGTITSPGAAH